MEKRYYYKTSDEKGFLSLKTKDTSGNSYHAKLTIEHDLNVSGSNSLISVGSKKNSEAQDVGSTVSITTTGATCLDLGG